MGIHFFNRPIITRFSELAIINLIVCIGLAIVDTVWAVYAESILHNPSSVGFLSVGFVFLALLVNFFLMPLFETKKTVSLYFFSLCIYALAYCLFCRFRYTGILFFLLYREHHIFFSRTIEFICSGGHSNESLANSN